MLFGTAEPLNYANAPERINGSYQRIPPSEIEARQRVCSTDQRRAKTTSFRILPCTGHQPSTGQRASCRDRSTLATANPKIWIRKLEAEEIAPEADPELSLEAEVLTRRITLRPSKFRRLDGGLSHREGSTGG